MDIIISMFITFCILIFSVFRGIFVGYPLLLSFFIFSFISYRRGFKLKDIIKMSFDGGKKSLVVLKMFILIGGITGIWMASGTVPGIIYYGIKYMNSDFFILYAFIISCIVSFLLGTALGTTSTVGVALILMAKGGDINVNIAAGAIIAGAYFGDRCSPVAASANLVADLTDTNLYTNIRNMFKTSIIPLILSLVIYFILSIHEPLNFHQSRLDIEILNTFNIKWIVLMPAIIILILSLFKINVKLFMFVSIVSAFIIAIIFQQHNLIDALRFMVLGFHLDTNSPLQDILKGGGIISMWKASFVIYISCALSGIFNETNMFKNIEDILMKADTRCAVFIYTSITSIATAAFGCNQSVSTVLTHHFMNNIYRNKNIDDYQLALDLENTGVVLSAIIPWNIAAFVPTTTMKVSSTGFIPYAFYLYLIPIINILYVKIFKGRKHNFPKNHYRYHRRRRGA